MMKLLKRVFIVFFIFIISLEIFDFFTSPNIEVINKAAFKIHSRSLQYIDNNEEVSDSDLTDWKYSGYVIGFLDSVDYQLNYNKRFLKEPLYFDISYSEFSQESNKSNQYYLKAVTFEDHPQFVGQQSYCGYTVEVYPNKRTVVTPTRKGWCIRPMYYHEVP